MAFIEIKDPLQRDRIVEDYIKTRNLIRNESEDEKAHGLVQQIQIEKTATPVLKATQDSAKIITKELKESRAFAERQREFWDKNYVEPAITYYLKMKKNRDKYFSIQKSGNHYIMGNEIIRIDDNSNIIVEGERYEGTPGLWALIMLAKPNEDQYTDEDFQRYEDLVEKTQVIFNPQNTKENSKPRMTAKYKNILAQLAEDYDLAEPKEEEPEDSETEKIGSGVQFLPSSISGLLDRLVLLEAEYDAGNTISCRNQIVAILDELLRRKYFTREQYNKVYHKL